MTRGDAGCGWLGYADRDGAVAEQALPQLDRRLIPQPLDRMKSRSLVLAVTVPFHRPYLPDFRRAPRTPLVCPNQPIRRPSLSGFR